MYCGCGPYRVCIYIYKNFNFSIVGVFRKKNIFCGMKKLSILQNRTIWCVGEFLYILGFSEGQGTDYRNIFLRRYNFEYFLEVWLNS